MAAPQWITSSRLLKVGETIERLFFLPPGREAGELAVFPRYLERAQPGERFDVCGDLSWLDGLEHESLQLRFDAGRATVRYEPKAPGSYLARWRVGGETLTRYFAVIEDDWVMLRHVGTAVTGRRAWVQAR